VAGTADRLAGIDLLSDGGDDFGRVVAAVAAYAFSGDLQGDEARVFVALKNSLELGSVQGDVDIGGGSRRVGAHLSDGGAEYFVACPGLFHAA
jgi:hypothetical protein